MWWNSGSELKEWMNRITNRLSRLENDLIEVKAERVDADEVFKFLSDRFDEVHQALVSQQTMDKFDDYMKNVEKLNQMVNEFKGCVAIARAAISDKKEMDEMRTILKNMIETCQKYYHHQKSISDQHFKIDAIYKALCEAEEKKPKKKAAPKKKATPDSRKS